MDLLVESKIVCIPFSPLAQGLLSNKYLQGIPEGSRAASHRGNGAIDESQVSVENINKVRQLNTLAEERGQNLVQMALAWILKDPRISSVLIGVSKPEQVLDSIRCLENYAFTPDELKKINDILK